MGVLKKISTSISARDCRYACFKGDTTVISAIDYRYGSCKRDKYNYKCYRLQTWEF